MGKQKKGPKRFCIQSTQFPPHIHSQLLQKATGKNTKKKKKEKNVGKRKGKKKKEKKTPQASFKISVSTNLKPTFCHLHAQFPKCRRVARRAGGPAAARCADIVWGSLVSLLASVLHRCLWRVGCAARGGACGAVAARGPVGKLRRAVAIQSPDLPAVSSPSAKQTTEGAGGEGEGEVEEGEGEGGETEQGVGAYRNWASSILPSK